MRYILTLLVLLAACSGNSDEVCKTSLAIHEWSSFRWDPTNYDLSIVDTTDDDEWGDVLEEVIDDWNGLDTALWLEEQDSTNADILVRLVDDAPWLGLAEVYLDGETGRVSRARVSINSVRMKKYNAAAQKHVMCQEIGHALGLFHIVGDTCMDDCANFPSGSPARLQCINAASKATPNEHDREQLITMYGSPPDDRCY